ncbi:alpha-N-acetylglucosaminidase [Cimex lectularius]|uniref:Alpha-N-acetylglucosaminidase n=1 Tax=Cimex lectularius TaxID=79782 RepID=A0A8I6TDG4_CIMLE|nr:alpha-N-acetylglucosaminidase [Cimex lectularius]
MWKCLISIVLVPLITAYIFEESLGKIGTKVDPLITENAVNDLMHRLIGKKSTLFVVKIIPELLQDGKDVFKVKKLNSSELVNIAASSGVAAAWGFHHYLKEFCNCHISWDGDQLNLPAEFPNVDITVVANDKFRYYQNVCTTSYSFVWWNWTRWEREIDWMAMNGFNLALAFNGQEEVWRSVYMQLGMSKSDISEHFSGPAFLSWNRMGNMRGWGGPLSLSWHKSSFYLQKSILNRMRQLGIIPVLPAFAGHVPRAFDKLFPDANLTLLPNWNNFADEYCCPYLLHPQDPLFQKVGKLFLRQYIANYGTDHVYNCDTFNEMRPTSDDPKFIRKIGKSIFASLLKEDPHAVWMLQGWVFKHDYSFWTLERSEALITSVPRGRLLILDLQAELNPQYIRLKNFFGQPFIWCMLHNFGGTLGMHGSVDYINENVFKARNATNSTMIGTGLTPEGINQNYVIYDLMMDMAWRKSPTNLVNWLSKYTTRRYGQFNTNILNGWILLKNSAYNYIGNDSQHGKYIFTQLPSLKLKSKIWFNESMVYEAWTYILQGSTKLNLITNTFKYDLVDLTRESLQLMMGTVYKVIVNSFKKRDKPCFFDATNIFMKLIYDLEQILASDEHFLLGRWLEDAKLAAYTPADEVLFEMNARNQITLWGPQGEIADYATKQWSGIVADYYTPRWSLFFECLSEDLNMIKPFNNSQCSNKIYNEVEVPFTYSRTRYPIYAKGDSLALAREIHDRWIQNKDRICT